MTAVISNLKKIGLKIRAGDGKEGHVFSSADPFTFIFGAASEGLCAFEILLDGKAIGERVSVTADQSEMTEVFGHLHRPLIHFLGLPVQPQRLHVEASVAGIEEATEKEIIQAMAAAVAGGCGGGCGCGCH